MKNPVQMISLEKEKFRFILTFSQNLKKPNNTFELVKNIELKLYINITSNNRIL